MKSFIWQVISANNNDGDNVDDGAKNDNLTTIYGNKGSG